MKYPLITSIFLFTLLLMTSCGDHSDTDGNTVSEKELNISEQIQGDDSLDISNIDSTTQTEVNFYPKNHIEAEGLKGKVKYLSIYTHDIDEEGEREGMSAYIADYDINEYGNFIEYREADCCGFGEFVILYEYTEDNLLIRNYHVYTDEIDEKAIKKNFTYKEKYFYNEEDQLVKMKQIDDDTVLTKEIEYDYIADGRMKEYVEFLANDVVKEHKFTYSDNSSKEAVFENGTWIYDVVTLFDTTGLPIAQTRSSDEHVYNMEFEYEFDEVGNWITCIETHWYQEEGKSSASRMKTTRGIKYY